MSPPSWEASKSELNDVVGSFVPLGSCLDLPPALKVSEPKELSQQGQVMLTVVLAPRRLPKFPAWCLCC